MKDKRRSDEELFDELDTMYQRVADLQGEEAASEHPSTPYEYGETTEGAVSSHEAVVSSPGHRAHGIPEKPFKKRRGRNKKWLYRRIVIIPMSFFLILFAFILILTIVKPMITPRGSNLGYVQRKTVASSAKLVEPPAGSPSVQMEQEAMQKAEENADKKESMYRGNWRADSPFTQDGYFAIQVGAFHEWENARDLMEVFKREGLDAHWISRQSRSRGILYIVFVGQFMDRNEAAEFVKGKSILNDYPDSFIQMVSSYQSHHSIIHPPDK
jgi:cell division septation protein DedD